MYKTYNILFVLLFTCVGCQKSISSGINSNKDIYDFMKIIIDEQKLNLKYGIRLEPESNFNLTEPDSESFKLLLTKLESSKQKTDSLNFRLDWNSLTLLSDLTKEDILGMISQKEDLKPFKWNNARLGFNLSNKSDWYSFSVPLFSKDKKKAVMMIRNLCSGLCGEGKTVLFIKKNGKWTSSYGMQWIH